MESVGLSGINYNHIQGGSSPSSRSVSALRLEMAMYSPGHHRNLRELLKDAQDAVNQSGEPDVQQHRAGGKTRPLTHKPNDATITNRGAISENKMWFS